METTHGIQWNNNFHVFRQYRSSISVDGLSIRCKFVERKSTARLERPIEYSNANENKAEKCILNVFCTNSYLSLAQNFIYCYSNAGTLRARFAHFFWASGVILAFLFVCVPTSDWCCCGWCCANCFHVGRLWVESYSLAFFARFSIKDK